MGKKTNYIIKACVTKDSDLDAIKEASIVAEALQEWVELDCRNNKIIHVGPDGDVFLDKKEAKKK